MRVCFVWSDVTAIGGVSSWIVQCLDALPKRGVEAHAINVTTRPAGLLAVTAANASMTIVSPQRSWESIARFRRRLARVLARLRPDILVLNEQLYALEFLQAAAGKMAVVNVVHSDRDSAYPILVQLLQWGVPQWCVSQAIVTKLKRLAPIEAHCLIEHTLLGVAEPQGSRAPTWNPGEILRVGYVGRVARYQKQIEDLPKFAAALRQRNIPAEINVVGDGPDHAWLVGEVEQLGLSDYVHFHGPLPHATAMQELGRQHIFLLFSNFEGLPLTLLEAMIRGVVPVVTDLPSGISEVVEDGVNGYVFPVGQVEKAVDRIAELMQCPQQYEKKREAAMATAQEYSFERQCDHFVDLSREVAANCRPVVPPSECGWIRDRLPLRLMQWWEGREG